jgi:hypothetical protein
MIDMEIGKPLVSTGKSTKNVSDMKYGKPLVGTTCDTEKRTINDIGKMCEVWDVGRYPIYR